MKKPNNNLLIMTAKYTLDTQGLRCPEPLMMVRKSIRHINNGDTLLVLSDDPATVYDIPNFCHFMDHTLIAQSINSLPYQYLLKKSNFCNEIT
ncbi:Sulfur carrier protein TusA [Candidatus Erwinia haradaeae]|uniref:Sulfur carrier protein TusA n=1 Tax=Candidatus Erwinia haradaeae TaxID=1922217 RepID=A0A451DIT7_9GAMM|nr:sulfurtransferase TusA [Candidatus Erwinia haradaeae]VFP86606.1 Sulfur carrier protein TusA [Candidatus Erwinia haradaeae]